MQWLINIILEKVGGLGYALKSWIETNFYTQSQIHEWITPVSVTGDLSPDGTCTYFKAGTYNDKPYYKRSDGAYFIWWYAGPDYWVISVTLGDAVPGNWYRVDYEILGPYQPFIPFTGIATVSEGRKYLCHGFVDRGDPVAFDFTIANFITDGTWRDLDLSAIVPAGAKAVLLAVEVQTPWVTITAQFRKEGNINIRNVSKMTTELANIPFTADLTCPISTDRFLQYRFSNFAWTVIYVTVKGWWL